MTNADEKSRIEEDESRPSGIGSDRRRWLGLAVLALCSATIARSTYAPEPQPAESDASEAA